MIYLFECCGLFALSNDKTGANVARLDRNGFWLLRTELSSQVVRSHFADAMQTLNANFCVLDHHEAWRVESHISTLH
jgi:hypothetical protein